MADNDDDWEGREGRWTRSSESSEGGGDERYYELPDGEVVQGEPAGDVEAEPVEAPEEEEEGGLAGLFGGDDDEEPDEEDLEEEEDDDDSSILPIVAGVVVLLLVLLVLLVGAAYLGIADPLGIGDALPGAGDGGDDGGGGDNGDGGGGNETELFSYPVNWTTANNTITDETGSLEEGDSAEVAMNISRRNLTSMSIVFQWDDGTDESVGEDGADTFTVELIAPDGNSTSATGSNPPGQIGFINLTMDLATVPTSPTAIEAETKANATQDLLAQQPAVDTWTGEWTVNITLEDANPCEQQTGPGGETVNVGTDCGQDWSFDLEYGWYDGILGNGTRVES